MTPGKQPIQRYLKAFDFKSLFEDRLCFIQEEKEPQEPQIICSLGLFTPEGMAKRYGIP
jgi:hypothetical protein